MGSVKNRIRYLMVLLIESPLTGGSQVPRRCKTADPSSDTLLSEGEVEGVGRSGLSFLKENVLLPPLIFSFYRKELAELLSFFVK